MSETDPRVPRGALLDDEPLARPRAISGLAWVGLVLGVAAALALTAPYMWLLPIAGVAVSIAALVSIARDPQGKIGRSAAVAGLVLSLLFGVWGISNHLARHRLLYRQSEVFATRWLQMVLDGELYAAHQLKMPQNDRRPPGTDLAAYYEEDTDANQSFREFIRHSPISDLIDMGPGAVCRFERNAQLESARDYSGPYDRIVQHFDIEPNDGDAQRTRVQIELIRSRDRWSGEAQWRVQSVTPVSRPRR
jgi:hypothetical protein